MAFQNVFSSQRSKASSLAEMKIYILTLIGLTEQNFEDALDHVILGMFTSTYNSQNVRLTIWTASDIHRKKKYPDLKAYLEIIGNYAQQHGLINATLGRVLEVLTSANALDQTTQKALIKVLYPADHIPSHLICTVVNGLGHGSRKASVSNQQLLLKWLIMVHDVLEDPSILSNLYSVFFNLLDMNSLRADLCTLLVKITRRKHVRPFRLQMLQTLCKKVGREPALSKLMQIYDSYAPGTLNITGPAGRVPEFSPPDPEWANKLERIRERINRPSTYSLREPEATLSFRRRNKRLRLSASVEGSYSLDRIDNAEDLVNNIEKIRITGLATPDLDDSVLQKYLTLDSDSTHTEDIDECLSRAFTQQLDSLSSGQAAKKPLAEVLDEALAYTRYTKVGSPSLRQCRL